jgi:preprotein translocase subunit SecA
MKEGERIESRMVTRRIEAAQKKVEERNFEIRKNLLEYDEVMDEQRKRIYQYRQRILDGANCRELILEMIDSQVNHHLTTFLDRDFGVETFAGFASSRLTTTFEPRQFRGMDFSQAEMFAKDEATRMAETDILGAIDENLPEGEEDWTGDWNWEAMAKFVNTRWNLSLRDRDLKRVGRDELAEMLIEKAGEAIQRVDLSEGAHFLDEDFGTRALIGWVHHKFGIELDPDEVGDMEGEALKQLVCRRAQEAYDQKESEYPVMAGLYRFTNRAGGGQTRIDRDSLIAWARDRFDVELDIEDLKNKQREEIRALLVGHSRAHQQQAKQALVTVKEKVHTLIESSGNGRLPGGNGAAKSLCEWSKQTLKYDLPPEDVSHLDPEQLEQKLCNVVEDRYHPEMRRMERAVLLQIVDTAWKDHLLTMDYLRSAVGLKGYAQLDPKVEYKREGMKLFDQMWNSIGERCTDLIFRMEQLDEGFVGSTWTETAAVHEEAQSTSEIAQQQQEAIDGSRGDIKIEPIRNRGQHVGRNDPCPCGSGKKYKNCCLRNRIA